MEIITLKEAKELYPDGKTISELSECANLSRQGVHAAACKLRLKAGIDYIKITTDANLTGNYYFGNSVERIINRSTKRTGRRKSISRVVKIRGKVGRPKKPIFYAIVNQDFDMVIRCDSNVKFQLVQNGEVVSEGNYAEISKLFYSA